MVMLYARRIVLGKTDLCLKLSMKVEHLRQAGRQYERLSFHIGISASFLNPPHSYKEGGSRAALKRLREDTTPHPPPNPEVLVVSMESYVYNHPTETVSCNRPADITRNGVL